MTVWADEIGRRRVAAAGEAEPRWSGDTLGDLIATLGSIDDDEIDWQNVRQATVLIHQTFRYDYPGPITDLRQRLMVVPPDYHGDQRLATHKLRVSGCNVDTRALLRQLRQRRARPQRRGGRRPRRVHDLGRRRARGRRSTAATSPTTSASTARFAEPSRLTQPDDALRAVGRDAARLGRRRARSGRADLRAACTTTSPTTGASRRSRRRPPRPGRGASACARTTRTAWSRSAGSAACPRATSRATCSATAAPTPGSRCSCRDPRDGERCGPSRSTRRTTAAPGRATSPSPSGATTATCRRPRARSRARTPAS